jgi:integrase
MPTIDLTKSTIRTLVCEPGKTETTFWAHDMPGFGLRCRRTGERRWFIQYRNAEGCTRKHTLDGPDTMTQAKARAKAKAIQADVFKGGDPAAAAGKVRGLITLEELAIAYLEHQTKHLRPRSYAEVERHLSEYYEPFKKLRPRKVATVTARDVVGMLELVAANNGPVAANRLRATVRAMWVWGLKSQRVTTPNPVTDTFKPAKEAPRARVLTDAEVALIWQHAGDGSYGAIVRLLMLTGQRREEVAGMRWSEITTYTDGSTKWVLPATRAKNGRSHDVPLLPLAVQQLPALRDDEL